MYDRITTAGLYVKNGSVLIARREKGGSISGKWEFPGGKNRYGESVSDTLKREYLEELGVAIVVSDEEFFSTDFENKGTRYHLVAHFIKPLSEDYRLSVHEEVRMVPLADLLSYDFAPSDYKIAEKLAKGNPSLG